MPLNKEQAEECTKKLGQATVRERQGLCVQERVFAFVGQKPREREREHG